MAYDIELTPKVVDSEDLDSLEKRIHEIEEHGIEIKAEQGFADFKDKIKEIEEKGINLEVKINDNPDKSSKEIEKHNAAISKLIQQLNTLAAFDGSKLTKTIDITFDIKNLTKEISDALSAVNNLKPNIAISTQDLEERFRELRKIYNKQLNDYEIFTQGEKGVSNGMYDSSWAKNDIMAYKAAFDEAIEKANELYNTCQSIDYLLSKDNSLEARLGVGKSYYSAQDTLGGFEGDFAVFADYLSMTDEQIEKTMNSIIGKKKKISDEDVFNTGTIQQVQSKTRNTGKSLENLGDQTESFIERFQTAITNLHSAMDSVGKDTNSIADNIKKLKTILDQMNQAVQQIKSPFDETSISNTATRLEELFKQYNSLDGTEKEMKIGVEISSEDEQKLKNVAKYADEIKSVMRNITTYKAIGSGQDSQGNNKSAKKKEQKESTDSQSGVANKESKKAVAETNKAVEAYDKLVPKEVKITLNVENLNDLETAVSHIKELDQRNENIAQDTVTSVKPKIQSGVFKPSNAKGNITPNNGSSGNNAPTDPDVSLKLQTIMAGENSILEKIKEAVNKLDLISKQIPSSEAIISIANKLSEQSQTTSNANEPNTLSSNNGTGDGGNNNTLKIIGDNIKTSVNLMSQAVDEFSSLLNRFSRRFPIQQNNNSGVSQSSADGDSGKQSLISTLIDPKLSAIQTAVTNIDNKIANTETSHKKADKNVTPPASSDVQNINKNVTNILSSLKSIGDKVAGKSKKSETSEGAKGGTKSKDNTSVIKDKLNNLPTKLNSLQQTNSSISKNTKAIQTNTGKISTKAGTINDTIKSKAGEISAQLSSIDNHVSQGNTPASPNAATKNDYTNLETAIKALTQTLSTPAATGSAQNAQNNTTAPSTAQAAANLANASSLQTQATNRIKELQTVLGFMNGGSFSSIFGSTQDIESYIVSLETLNKEIASAGKMLNRNDISAAQRSNTEQKLSTNTAILNGYINGDDSLGINATQIANINALLQAMTTINSRITGADAAFEGLTKLKETLKSYDITVQPLQAAIDNLKATRENLKQMSDKISSSSLTEQEFANLQTAITSAETSYQEAINKSNELLNTNQKDSLQSITSEFNQAQQEVTKYSAKIEKLKNFLRDLKAKKIDLSTIDMGNGRTAKDMEAFLADYEKAIALKHNFNSMQEMQTYAANFAANYQTPLKQYVDGLGEANRQFKNMTQAASESIQHNNFGKQLADFTTSVKKWGDTNSGVFSRAEFKDRYNKIMTELTSGSVQSADQLARLRSEFANLKLAANQAGVATKSFTAKLKEMYKKYGGWTLVTKTLNTAMRLLRSMVTQVKEVDTAMTNLKKVTEATGNQLNTFLESAGKRSVALGASLTDYVDAVSEFSRLGKSLDEAQKLGELATTYKTVAEDLDIKTASKSIISTMQAFNSVGVQADEIVDKFNYVGNNFAASSAEIGESLQRSAAALSGASNSLSESIGLITSAQTVVQNAETVGTSLKTISARIRGTTSELGDDADDLVITTSKLRKEIKALTNVDVMNGNQIKSTYQILDEIAAVYDKLDDSSQSRVAELLGGKVGYNTIQSILGNFETARQIVEELNSGMAKGSATKELERSLDSIQGKLNQLKSSWQQLSTDLLGTETIKSVVDALKGLVTVLDTLVKSSKALGGTLGGVLSGTLIGGIVNNSIRKQTNGNLLGFRNNGKWGMNFLPGIQPETLPGYSRTEMNINAIKQAKINGDDLDSLTELSAEMREYAKSTDVANMSVANFYATQTKSAQGFLGSVQAIKTYNKMASMEQRMAFADAVKISNQELGEHMRQLNGANASAKTYFSTIKLGIKNIGSAFAGGLMNVAISAVIGGLIKLISYLSQSYERMLERNAELSKSLKETTDEIKENSDEINSLMSQYANIVVTTSDLAEAQSQLIDIQNKLTKSLGLEKDQLDLVGNSYADNIKLIQERRKKIAEEFTEETKNQKKYEDAKKRLEQKSTISENFGVISSNNGASIIKSEGLGNWGNRSVWEVIRQLGLSNTGISESGNKLFVTGTIDEQIKSLEALNTELTDLWGNKPLDANEHKWLNAIQNRIDVLKEEKSTAEEMIKKFEELNAVGDLSDKTYSEINKIQDVVNRLQTAENAKEIIELSSSYRQLKDDIFGAIPEEDTATRDYLNTFFEAIEKTIDKHILEINNEANVLSNVYKKFQDETYDKFTTQLSKLDSAIKTLSSGDYIDDSAMNELIKMDELALEDFQKTSDGYTVSLSNLLKLRQKLIDEQKEDITDTLDEEKKLYANQLAQIEQLEKEYEEKKDDKTKNDLVALKKQAAETNKRIEAYQAWYQMVSENIQSLQEEIYEKISSKVSKVDSAIKSLSSGEYLDAATLAELVKVDSSLVGQFQKSIEGYTISIDTLYKARKKLIENQRADIEQAIAYNKKEIEKQEFVIEIYKRMVYDKSGQLLSDQARKSAINQANADKKKAEEDLKYWEMQRDLINQNIDAISIFQQALSEVKGFKDDITSLYSDDGIDDQFFIDHPELLQYRNDISALAEEIQKLAKTKASPVIEQLRAAMNESISNGDFEGARKYNSMIEQLNQATDLSNLNMLEKQKKKIREQVEEKERYIKKLERQKDKEQKILDKLNKQKEILEKQEEKYQTASKTAQDYIDELIDTLEAETDALEENKKAIEEDFDARIQAIKDLMDAIDKETDAIDKEAEAQERLNDLKEKELALEKARNTKVRVYTAERGWQIMADSEAIATAQKDYDKALADYNKWKRKEEDDARKAELQAQIDALEKEKEAALASVDAQIEAIEAQKKEFEEYKQLWEDALNAYQKLQDGMTAAAILGSDWREKVSQKDTEVLNTFAENYNKIEQELHGVVEKRIEQIDKTIEKYDEQINKQNDLKSAQETYLSYYETYSKSFVDLTNAQTAALERLKKALDLGDSEAALDAILDADKSFGEGKNKNETKLSNRFKLTDMYTRLMQTAPTALVDGIKSTFDSLKNLPNNLKSVMSSVNNSTNVSNDNRTQTINVNNPGLAMTESAFMAMLTGAFVKMNQESQIGKK